MKDRGLPDLSWALTACVGGGLRSYGLRPRGYPPGLRPGGCAPGAGAAPPRDSSDPWDERFLRDEPASRGEAGSPSDGVAPSGRSPRGAVKNRLDHPLLLIT
jgi:hypothetical protein